MTSVDRLRLMTRVARLYYEQGLRQPEIAKRLSLSQATVSRLYPELEEALQQRFDLIDAVVADCASDSRDQVLRDVGSAAAAYLESTLAADEVIGISSWSETLLRTVGSMQPRRRTGTSHVVQILGGIGNPGAEVHAIRLTERFAALLHAEPHFLAAPGVTASPEATTAYLSEPLVRETAAYFDRLSVALVGIGALHPSSLLGESGNVFSEQELAELDRLGAVGDICLRFFDRGGQPVISPFNDRVVAISLAQLRGTRRSVGVAGTAEKLDAIRGALEGRLINVLVTDRFTAARLLTDEVGDRVVELPASGRR
jgi:DNA-binding transcriptional regulator LsrR (DeoR family)